MKLSLPCSIAIALLGLTFADAGGLSARETVDRPDTNQASVELAPKDGLSLGAGDLLQEAAGPSAHRYTQIAQGRTTTRRVRPANPRRNLRKHRKRQPSSISPSGTSGVNAPAPLDCSIESHPDCPRSTGSDAQFDNFVGFYTID